MAPTTANPRNVADRILRKVEAGQTERVVVNLADSGVAVAEGTWVRVGRTEPRPWNNDIARQLDDVVRRTVELLDRVPGDAVLHFDYEVVWLVRRGGELSLNDRDDIWTPARLAAVGRRPHRRGTPVFS